MSDGRSRIKKVKRWTRSIGYSRKVGEHRKNFNVDFLYQVFNCSDACQGEVASGNFVIR